MVKNWREPGEFVIPNACNDVLIALEKVNDNVEKIIKEVELDTSETHTEVHFDVLRNFYVAIVGMLHIGNDISGKLLEKLTMVDKNRK